jgi:hypothetical protein
MLPPMRKDADREVEEVEEKTREEEYESEDDAEKRPPLRRQPPRRRRAADHDEDDEDDELPVRRRSKQRARAQPSAHRRRGRRPQRAARLAESQIDAPRKQTLYLLGAVAGATVIMWGAARFACNAHAPISMRPHVATIDQLARTPKGAAIELEQRWATNDFAAALELTKGELHQQVMQEQQRCEADLSWCDAQREQVAGKVISMGEVLSRGPRSAKVRVRTTIGTKTTSHLLELEPNLRMWKVVKRTAEQS